MCHPHVGLTSLAQCVGRYQMPWKLHMMQTSLELRMRTDEEQQGANSGLLGQAELLLSAISALHPCSWCTT